MYTPGATATEDALAEPSAVTTPQPLISLVIPCYNEERRIQDSLAILQSFLSNRPAGSVEIILVDDGSTDGTAEIIQSQVAGFRYLHHKPNRGKGYSIRQGIQAAAGPYIFYTDVDIPFGLEPLDRFLAALQQGAYLAGGGRDLPGSRDSVGLSPLRHLSSGVFTFVVVRFITPGIPDTQCGFKGFRRQAARDIFGRCRLNRYAFDVEAIFLARQWGYQIVRLPVVLLRDEHSKVQVLRDSLQVLVEIARMLAFYALGVYRLPPKGSEDTE